MKLKYSFISFIISSSFIISCSCHKEKVIDDVKNKYVGEDSFDETIEEVNSGYSKIDNVFSIDNFYSKYCNKIEASEEINSNLFYFKDLPKRLYFKHFKDRVANLY